MEHYLCKVRKSKNKRKMATTELKVGDLIDERYRITSETCPAGGMATIHPAIDVHTNRKVAIKVAAPESTARDGLNREAQILRTLHPHPNIVPYIGETLIGDRHGLIVEWLEIGLGDQIATYMNKPWISLMDLMGNPLLYALQHAHNANFQHRDVHPGNIMFSPSGQLRLIDFGIAQVPKVGYDKITFFQHGTPPYTPQEHNDSTAGFARDCYSAIAVMLSCISGRVFSTYEEMTKALSTLDPANYPVDIFRSCLTNYPENCPRNAGTLRAKLQSWTDDRFPESSSLRLIVRTPPQSFFAPLGPSVSWQDVLDDLMSSSLVHIDDAEGLGSAPTIHIAGQNYRASFELQDAQRSVIQLSSKVGANKGSWAQGFPPLAVSLLVDTDAQRKGTPWHTFVCAHGEALEDEVERQAKAKKELPFICWENYLSAEQELLAKKPGIVHYKNLSVLNDHEFFFEVNSRSARNMISEDASLISGNNKKNLIRVLDIEDNRVRARAKYSITLPPDGVLSVEYHALKQALGRKRRALLSVRDGLSVSPLLRDYITDPTTVPPPEMSGRDFEINDEHQATAVDGALGTRSWIMIEGPPGTGKSTVIAKIINQYRIQNRQFKPRILLAAQTHIAIDTVLRKLLDDPTLSDSIVRIPSGDIEKVDPQVRPLLVENKVKAFRDAAICKSEAFLESIAKQRGSDHRVIRLAIYTGLYKATLDEEQEFLVQLKLAESETKQVIDKEEGDNESQTQIVTRTVSLVTREDELREELAQIKDRLARLRFEILSTEPELSEALNSPDPSSAINEYDEVFGPELKKDSSLAALVRLQLDWLKAISAGRALHQAVVQDSTIVAGTCVGIGSAISEQEFDLCIVDEASKALAVEALIPMARAKKWILVGDTKQLPPHLDREVRIQNRDLAWIGDSLLQSLPRLAKENANQQKLAWYFSLKNQRRMTRGISDLISKVFYDNELTPLREDTSRNNAISKAFPKPVTWVDVNGISKEDKDGTRSLSNEKEVAAVLRQLTHLEGQAKPHVQEIRISVAVIAGYAAQVELLSAKINEVRHQWPHLDIEIASIDRFQGNEKDVAIVSLVRGTNERTLGHLDDKRINVAFSRAKDALVIVGSSKMVDKVGKESKLAEALDYIRRNRNACIITSPQ